MQLQQPTPVQEKAYPVIMSGRDTVGIAQTGTGKTLAYLLPLLRQHEFSNQRHPRVLIIVPTRELVVQVVGEIEKLSAYMSVRYYGVYGASNINTQKQAVYNGLDILVATPGRLMDLYLARAVQFSNIKKLVIDEVDEMLNLGFRPQLMQILEVLPLKRQNILFSATLEYEVEDLIKKYFNRPEFVEMTERGTPLENITQQAYWVPNFNTKINLIRWLLRHEKVMDRVLVFVKDKHTANDLEMALTDFAEEMDVIHSNKTQPNRFNAVKQFAEGVTRILIATDVIARGLDLPDITHVINFDVPSDPATYIHRIGRTGRSGKKGTSISFFTRKNTETKKELEALMKKEINFFDIPEDVKISHELRPDEIPVVRDKNLAKQKKVVAPSGAFHEKKAKNKKIQLGGKRKQETQRRALEKNKKLRKR